MKIQKEYILVSACLLGINCRYDGKNSYSSKVAAMVKNFCVIFACPEQLGGLETPRAKNKIISDRVLTEKGVDVTEQFYRGAHEFVNIAKRFRVKKVVLKSRSPSCGKHGIVSRILPKNIVVEYKR